MNTRLVILAVIFATVNFALCKVVNGQGYRTVCDSNGICRTDIPSTAPSVSPPRRPTVNINPPSISAPVVIAPMGMQVLSSKCGTSAGSCFINQVGNVGTPCWCNSYSGQVFYGQLIP